ncbi:MAG: hypothetical protein KIT84_12720 [Labilithrix sp.]|nr:hypothetical protein [Labilithrix sp.]MCW5811878.1 hypothetical protein [Labilithrix sp.]
MAKTKNDRTQAVTKFCLAMEEHRRTEAGRVRTARELVATFFPYDDSQANDKLFHLMPNEVRGPILSQWGIRGGKAALKDDDAKVQHVVHDALVAGDIDEAIFEEGVTAQILVDWVGLADWWSFWRHGKLTGVAIQKALHTARELEIIDDRWFFANVQGRGGKLKGTDVVCDTLSKDQVVAWMRKLHETGDGSPAGLVGAIGWETILAKTAQDALLFALDAFARKAELVPEAPEAAAPKPEPAPAARSAAPKPEAGSQLKSDSGFPIAIPDVPAVDAADDDPPSTPSLTSTQEQALWGGTTESPNLVEARAKMMEMLGNESAPASGEGWGASEPPAPKPSGLDWGEAPAIGAESGSKPPAPPPVPKKPVGPTPRR